MKRWLSVLLGAVLLMLAASCSQSPTLGIKLGTSTISIVRGNQDTVAVTIAGSGGGPVTLTISGAPPNVTATLTEVTLPAGATSTTLQLQVAAAAAEGSYTVTVHGTSGSLAASADLTLDITSLTVNGSVHGFLDDGFPGAKVAIQGMTTTTDASGAFVIGGVSVPYDVAVGVIAGTQPIGQLFMGMTASDPVLTPLGTITATLDSYYPEATVTGNLSAAVPAGSEANICLEGVGVAIYGCDTVSAGSTAYTISAFWQQGTSVSFTLHALVTQLGANRVPTGYDAYGTAAGSVAAAGTTAVNVTLGAAPTTNTLTLSMNAPAGFDSNSFTASAEISSDFTMPVFSTDIAPSTSLTVAVPRFGGATYSATASASPSGGGATSIGWKQKIPSSSTTTFDLDAPATLIAPTDGVTGIGVGSTLQISSTGGAPVTFIMSSGSSDPIIAVTTMDNSISIPDLTTVGAPLPAATSYSWTAYMSPSSGTIEQAADTWLTDFYGALLAKSGGPGSRLDAGVILGTARRGFTTP